MHHETRIDESMNVFAGGARHDRYFSEVDEILIAIFSREPLSAQPRYVADMACGDGAFLLHVYTIVRDRTLRGKVSPDHPLTLIGIDLHKDALEQTRQALGQIDHLVLPGDIGNPRQVVDDLRRAGIDPDQVLHIHPFVDHDRLFREPVDRAAVAARTGYRYPGAYADHSGRTIPAAAIAQSRVAHMRRWAEVLNAHGLIVLDIHCEAPHTVRNPPDGESLSPGAPQDFFKHQVIEADVALMTAAEAGLFPRAEYFRKSSPLDLPLSRVMVNLFERQSYRARPASIADVPTLLRLEDACWPEGMRMPGSELERRIVNYGLGQWVLEIDGKVIGVIYSQRITHLDQLRNRTYPELAALHRESGSVVQLLALNVFPEMQHLGLGYQLLDLVLMRSALQGGVSQVAALTRCRDFKGDSLEALAAYVDQRDDAGRPIDPILNFHHSHGAAILGLAPGFRPEDTANLGAGVLVCYDIATFGTSFRTAVNSGSIAFVPKAGADTATRLESCFRQVPSRKENAEFSWTLPLRDMGLDSLDILALRTLLEQAFEQPLSPTFFFSHPTLRDVHRFFERPSADLAALEPTPPDTMTFEMDARKVVSSAVTPIHGNPVRTENNSGRIAIVGMACRFPGCADLDEYWDLLARGGDAVTEVPPQRWDVNKFFSAERNVPGTIVSRQGGFLADIDEFDAAFFNISPREARLMDPQQRILLETHWESLERAGIDPTRLRDTSCGIFVGLSSHDYEVLQVETGMEADLEAHYATGNSAAIAAGRLAYFLGTRGPALTLDTACSSSLVAVHQAVRSLRSGECDLAMASGANLILSPRLSIAYSRAGMLSPHGRCRTFDTNADGYVRAEGCGVVVMKRLDDAYRDGDVILAILRGSAVNQDGASNGLTAPNLMAQEQLLRGALKDANLQPAEVDYIEAHGTGTSLGDPVEFHSLQAVFATKGGRTKPLWLGSVKTNIGHTEAAAGIAGLIKVVLSMQRQWLPAHLHFETANPHIDLGSIPARIPVGGHPWRRIDPPLRAGVNSFGISGTNAHVLVEQAPAHEAPPSSVPGRSTHILPLSAKSGPALRALLQRYLEWLDVNPQTNLGNMCHTAGVGRAHHDHRMAVIAKSREQFIRLLGEGSERISKLGRIENAPKVAFLFTGQGSQYPGMARELSQREPVFRRAMAECSTILRSELNTPLEDIIYSTARAAELDDTANTQPALFAVEYALARMLQSWGVHPSAVMGHSVGEYVAACVAGVFSVEDGLRLIAARGRLMGALPQDGAMLAVMGRSDLVTHALEHGHADISVGAYNGPDNTVISGRREAIDRLQQNLGAAGVKSVRLQVSHAFHSPLMEPMLRPFAEIASRGRFYPPTIEFISNVTGERAGDEVTTAEYWCRHVRQPVRFEQGINALLLGGAKVMLEIGPHPVLSGMGRKNVGDWKPIKWLHTLERGLADWDSIAAAIGELYETGLNLAWASVDAAFSHQRISLPTYPWQRQPFWFRSGGSAKLHTGGAQMAQIEGASGVPTGRDILIPSAPSQNAADMLFDLVWQPHSNLAHAPGKPAPDYLPDLTDLRRRLHRESSQRLAQSTGATHSAVALFDALAVKYVMRAFRDLGWAGGVGTRVTAGTLMNTLGIPAGHSRLVARMLDMLAEVQVLEPHGAEWEVVRSFPPDDLTALSAQAQSQLPDHAVELRLFERCASRLAEVLTGRCDPLQLLFPQDSVDSVGTLYDNSAMSSEPNALMNRLVTAIAGSVPSDRVFRVLEIGAGTGGTTSHLLPLLRTVTSEYVFTDVSKLFLTRAAEKYRSFAGIQYALLDIEQPPATQGLASGQFDLIIAANVLHATRDMQETLEHVRTLLAPGGMLALIEGIRPARWIDLVFGQTEGWCRFSDLDLRPSHPLLSIEKWNRVLNASGFAEVATLPTQSDDRPNVFEQAIVMAKTSVMADGGQRDDAMPVTEAPSTWLIFGDNSILCAELTNRLESLGNHVMQIVADSTSAQTRSVFPVDTADEDAVAHAVVSALATAVLPCKYAVCLWGASLAAAHGIADEFAQTTACLTKALYAARAVIRGTPASSTKICFVTRGTQPACGATPDARAAALWGFGRVLASEHPEAYGGIIDLESGANSARDADAILFQVQNPGGVDQCAFRSGVRFIPQLMPTPAAAESALEWPADGCYIVTGGLSGVGLHLAQWMAKQGARRLVLMSRRGLPPRGEWERIAPQDARYESISRILNIERMGTRVMTLAVDIADEAALSGTMQSLNAERWLPVQGVIHAATASDYGLITNLEGGSICGSLRAKVLGTLTLESCLADQPLKFFVYCSSLTSLQAQEGQANYAAANAFLDAHVARRRSEGHPALGVNWGSWYGAGSAATKGGRRTVQSLEQHGFRGFSPEAGVAALDLLLRRNATQAAVMLMDWPAFRDAYPAGAVPPLLQRLVAAAAPATTLAAQQPGPTLGEQILALEAGGGRAAAVEQYLRETIADVLGLEAAAIDSTMTLGTLGLDSLMGVEFRNRCERSLGLRLSATMVWNYPTVADLTRYLSEKLALEAAPLPESQREPESVTVSSPADARPAALGDVRDLSEEAALQALLAMGAE